MIRLFTFLAGMAVLFVGCGGEATGAKDLEGLKKELREKKAALKTLQSEITALEASVEEKEPNKAPRRQLISTMEITKSDFAHFVEIQGNVASDDFSSAVSEIPGRITFMKLKEGDAVKKGQLVAKIDMESVDKQVDELNKALELAKDVFTRQESLWKQKIGSEIQFLQAKNNKERLEKSLESARFQKTKANVYAPISGVVQAVNLKAGEVASPGMPILNILNTDKVKVVAEVPETFLKAIKKGQKVELSFPALDRTENLPISLISKTINPANRTFQVEVNLSNRDGLLKPNLQSTVRFKDQEIKNTVVIPVELVQQEADGQDYVYLNVDGKATKAYVTTGPSFEGKIVIEKGLEGGEQIIVEGARSLAENELVQVKDASPKTK